MRNLALTILTLMTISCGELSELTEPGGSVPPVDPTATFTRVQNEIFTPTCAQVGCHDLLGRQQGLVLVAGQGHGNIVNIPSEQMPALRRIQPGNFADSYLYRKITGAGITGDRMPQGLPPLSAAQIALVRDWIRRGAPND
ncbi:MAG TPA: hypothetical protein VF057_04205 [Thermoanaerobaculia bacterium]